MKFTIAMFSLIISANLFAYSVTDLSAITSISPLLSSATTSGGKQKLQADAILNDAQEMLQSGQISIYLFQKIKETQNINRGISESEALDILIEASQVALAN